MGTGNIVSEVNGERGVTPSLLGGVGSMAQQQLQKNGRAAMGPPGDLSWHQVQPPKMTPHSGQLSGVTSPTKSQLLAQGRSVGGAYLAVPGVCMSIGGDAVPGNILQCSPNVSFH